MTAIPSKSDFTDASTTEGEYKTALEALHDYLTGQLGSAGTQASALATLGALGGNVSTRSTAYTVAESDRGHAIVCTGTFTLSLTSAATLGAGFSFSVINGGSGTVTIDPAGSETVGGKPTVILGVGSSATLISDGVRWFIMGANTTTSSDFQLFTASGTFTVPDGVTKVKATVIGGGGGGGAGDEEYFEGGAGNLPGGFGGNGGQWSGYVSVTPGSQISVIVGLGGAGSNANSSSANGSNGESSFFGSMQCTGGFGGKSSVGSGTGAAGADGYAVNPPNGFGGKPYLQEKRPRASSGTSPVSYSGSGPFYPGAGGSGELRYSSNDASGGVGGMVLVEW